MLAGIMGALANVSMSQAHKRAAQKELAKEFVDLEMTRFDRHVEKILHQIELMEKDLFLYCNVDEHIPKESEVEIKEHMKLQMKHDAVNQILVKGIGQVKEALNNLKK